MEKPDWSFYVFISMSIKGSRNPWFLDVLHDGRCHKVSEEYSLYHSTCTLNCHPEQAPTKTCDSRAVRAARRSG
jgi:hypothetical protein